MIAQGIYQDTHIVESADHSAYRPGIDASMLFIDSNTQECLYYDYIRAGETRVALPREKIGNRMDLDVRIDLLDCSIDVCSVDVPALFSENFDYQELRADFVHGVLTSDILGKTIYVHTPQKGYAARVKDTKSYAAIRLVSLITMDTLYTYSIAWLARTFYHGERSLLFLTIPRRTNSSAVMFTLLSL